MPFITWLTCFQRRAAHDVEPKNHQQEQKKLPRVSAVAARWTIPHRLVSVRKKNRAWGHWRNLHLESEGDTGCPRSLMRLERRCYSNFFCISVSAESLRGIRVGSRTLPKTYSPVSAPVVAHPQTPLCHAPLCTPALVPCAHYQAQDLSKTSGGLRLVPCRMHVVRRQQLCGGLQESASHARQSRHHAQLGELHRSPGLLARNHNCDRGKPIHSRVAPS